MPAKLCVVMAVGWLMLSVPAVANPYDDCVLEHMVTAQNQAAAYAIERACISKTSVPIPPTDDFAGGLGADLGDFNTGNPFQLEYGLAVTLKNTTGFNITEVVVRIRNKNTGEITRYPVSAFSGPLLPGAMLTELGEPGLLQIIKPGETRRFFVHIEERAAASSDFEKAFAWGVTPTKGIPPG